MNDELKNLLVFVGVAIFFIFMMMQPKGIQVQSQSVFGGDSSKMILWGVGALIIFGMLGINVIGMFMGVIFLIIGLVFVFTAGPAGVAPGAAFGFLGLMQILSKKY